MKVKRAAKILLILAWIGIIVFFIINRDRITVDGIIDASPSDNLLAALLVLVILALKSVTVFVYSGVIFAACGIMFPLPLAIAVSMLGVASMSIIPYFIGRGLGREGAEKLIEKYPKLNRLHELRTQNEFGIVLLTRLLGLPNDPLSAYYGAVGTDFKNYMAATLIGMLPSTVALTVMGDSINDPGSPEFIISIAVQIAFIAVSAIILYAKRKKS